MLEYISKYTRRPQNVLEYLSLELEIEGIRIF